MFFLLGSVGPEFRRASAGWFWLRLSHEVADKTPARVLVTGRLDRLEDPFSRGSLTWL